MFVLRLGPKMMDDEKRSLTSTFEQNVREPARPAPTKIRIKQLLPSFELVWVGGYRTVLPT